ncbi:hypothetical protein ACFE04_026753 [Oxalis oulophora]
MSTILNLTVLALFIAAANAATTYTNHTVGGTAGWFFNSTTNTSASNYTDWASSQTFNLGDYLIFNTNTNMSVIQTYNETTYTNCTTDEDESEGDTFVYSGGGQQFGQSLTIDVPLTITGTNYYFSEADDGEQCLHGMAFQILVNHGLGLPPSLNQPPPPPYAEPPDSDSAQSTPGGGSGSNSSSTRGNRMSVVARVVLLAVVAVSILVVR